MQIAYALANVYDDTPDLDALVTDQHRRRAEELMACVESGATGRLQELFEEIEEEDVLDEGRAAEVATYLIISAAQVCWMGGGCREGSGREGSGSLLGGC